MKVVLNVLSLVTRGEPAGTRTQGPRLKRAMLYRLSYRLTILIDGVLRLDDRPVQCSRAHHSIHE